ERGHRVRHLAVLLRGLRGLARQRRPGLAVRRGGRVGLRGTLVRGPVAHRARRPVRGRGAGLPAPADLADGELPGAVTGPVLLDLYAPLAVIDRDAITAGRRRSAALAGVDPACLVGRWTETIDARSLGALGTPRDELRDLLRGCAGNAADEEVVGAVVD